jgi:Protein of unknown function (DUF3485)
MQATVPSARVGRWARAVTGGAALLLLGAVVFQFVYRLREVPQPVARAKIADVVPRALAGWSVVDEPLGETEAVNQAALKKLNLDDFVFRRFQRGAQSFSVYAAYWVPGKMPTRLVASHTPDRCWTENGMRCVEMRFRENYLANDRPLLPAEYRAFTPPNSEQKTFVVYWHLVEGKIYDYGARFNAVPSPWLWWKDTLAQATYGSREQLFVRIVSELPMETLWKDRDFQSVLQTVAGMGLLATAP